MRSEEELRVDYEWYLSQQILPPLSRLCEPIEVGCSYRSKLAVHYASREQVLLSWPHICRCMAEVETRETVTLLTSSTKTTGALRHVAV
jgi:hypothetical protein